MPVADWTSPAPPAQTPGEGGSRRDLVVNAELIDDPTPGWRIVAAPSAWAAWSRGPADYVPTTSGVFMRGPAESAFADVIDSRLLMVAFAGNRVVVSSALAASDEPASSTDTDRTGATDTGDVRALANEAKRLSGLTDAQLAAVFPGEVARETFNRWRNRLGERPTPANVRRLALLRRLFAHLDESAVPNRTWLLAPLADGEQSPYDFLAAGRLSEVEELVAMLPREGDATGGEVQRARAPSGILVPDEPHAVPDVGMHGDEEGWVEVEISVADAE